MVKIIEGNELVSVCETNGSLSREEEGDIRVTAARCARLLRGQMVFIRILKPVIQFSSRLAVFLPAL